MNKTIKKHHIILITMVCLLIIGSIFLYTRQMPVSDNINTSDQQHNSSKEQADTPDADIDKDIKEDTASKNQVNQSQDDSGDDLQADATNSTTESKVIPILMMHHFSDDPTNYLIITGDKFRESMTYLKEHGYTTINHHDMIDFVYNGKALPDKPVMITMDDGYSSNYEIAFPILKELDMKATLFVIGSSMGNDTYKETDYPIFPHFDIEEAREMLESGLITIGNHTYDMHQSAALEPEGAHVQPTMTRVEGYPEEDYIEMVQLDHELFLDVYNEMADDELNVLAYPLGDYDDVLNDLLIDLGYTVTFAAEPGRNVITQGRPETLIALYRTDITMETDMATLLAGLE